jgi:hypothetical protein
MEYIIKKISEKIKANESLLLEACKEKDKIAIDVISNRLRYLREEFQNEEQKEHLSTTKIETNEKNNKESNYPIISHIQSIP